MYFGIMCIPHNKRDSYQMTEVPPPPLPTCLHPHEGREGGDRWEGSVLTSDFQLALHLVLAQRVDSHAGVFAPVEGARLANVEGQHSLVVLHQVLGILADDHLVLHPDNLRLRLWEKSN